MRPPRRDIPYFKLNQAVWVPPSQPREGWVVTVQCVIPSPHCHLSPSPTMPFASSGPSARPRLSVSLPLPSVRPSQLNDPADVNVHLSSRSISYPLFYSSQVPQRQILMRTVYAGCLQNVWGNEHSQKAGGRGKPSNCRR